MTKRFVVRRLVLLLRYVHAHVMRMVMVMLLMVIEFPWVTTRVIICYLVGIVLHSSIVTTGQ
jgi:hypothetical protein